MTSNSEEYTNALRRKSTNRRFANLFEANETFYPKSDDSLYPDSDSEENFTMEEQEQSILGKRSPLFSSYDNLASTISELDIELIQRHKEEYAEVILTRDMIQEIRDFLYGDCNSENSASKSNDLDTELNSKLVDSKTLYSEVSCASNRSHLLDVARIGSEASDVLSNRSGVLEVNTEESKRPLESVPVQSPSGYQRVNRRNSSLFSPLYTKLPELLVEYIKERPDFVLPDDFSDGLYQNIAKIEGTNDTYLALSSRSDQKFSKCKSTQSLTCSVVPKPPPQIRVSNSSRTQDTQSADREMCAEINSDIMNQTVVLKHVHHKQDSKSTHAHEAQVPKQFYSERIENKTAISKQMTENLKSSKRRKERRTKRFYEKRRRERKTNISYGIEMTSSQTYQGDEETDDCGNEHLKARKRKLKDDSQNVIKRFKIYKLCSCRNHVCDENTY